MEQNIKTEVHGDQAAVQPIDRSKEVLIDPETSFNDLLCLLKSRPEAAEADKLEHEAQESEAEEARLRAAFGEDYEAVVEGTAKKPLEKAKRRPGAIQLRNEVPRRRFAFSSGFSYGILSYFSRFAAFRQHFHDAARTIGLRKPRIPALTRGPDMESGCLALCGRDRL